MSLKAARNKAFQTVAKGADRDLVNSSNPAVSEFALSIGNRATRREANRRLTKVTKKEVIK